MKSTSIARLVCFLLLLALSALSYSADDKPRSLKGVSLVHLIAYPERYVGFDVTFFGFADFSESELRVYLTRDDAHIPNKASSILVTDPKREAFAEAAKNCHGKAVHVIGRFDRTEGVGWLGITKVSLLSAFVVDDPAAGTVEIWMSDERREKQLRWPE